MNWGYSCSVGELEACDLTLFGMLAEDAGFDFMSVTGSPRDPDALAANHPSPWSAIGAIASRTRRLKVGTSTSVTRPLGSCHPAIIAQTAATCSDLSSGRVFVGLGAGQRVADPDSEVNGPGHVPQQMLIDAFMIIRSLCGGETVDHLGDYYDLDDVRLISQPNRRPTLIWSATGATSGELAAKYADGVWSTEPDRQLVEDYRRSGGDGEIIGQVPLMTPRHTTGRDCAGDDDHAIQQAQRFVSAGFTSVEFHHQGPDQRRFLDWWRTDLGAAVRGLSSPGIS
jgi:G6PDH family F420-dependent oxidoreductase